jgi:lipoprotein-anchoring transpeptidase ErfK/SrfK
MQPSYYHSSQDKNKPLEPTHRHRDRFHKRHRRFALVFVLFLLLAVAADLGINHFMVSGKADAPALSAAQLAALSKKATPVAKTPVVTPAPVITPTVASGVCASNTLPKLVVVSISARHLYACQGNQQVYDSPVVTGISYLAADLTPTGTYHVYAKETNKVLTGCDSTGCWHDAVSYWMPFLDNQYGAYGFHDATWRAPGDFGNISPDSANASHGCVECPLATAAWLYNWTDVGTTVTVTT